MYGNDTQMGSISVYPRYANTSVISSSPVLTISGNKGQQWLRAVYSITDVKPFQFVIEGKIGSGEDSEIAIDDVSFSEGCIGDNTMPFTTNTKNPVLISLTGQSVTGKSVTPGNIFPGYSVKPTKTSIGNTDSDKNKRTNSKF